MHAGSTAHAERLAVAVGGGGCSGLCRASASREDRSACRHGAVCPAFIAEPYADRHLDIEVAQLVLSNVAHHLIVAHLDTVAQKS
jgi:hypothetical protein